jgi:hypothetical protein
MSYSISPTSFRKTDRQNKQKTANFCKPRKSSKADKRGFGRSFEGVIVYWAFDKTYLA